MITYSLVRSRRRTLAIEVHEDGSVIVRAPKSQYRKADIDAFVRSKEAWILEKLALQQERRDKAEQVTPLSEQERRLYREKAREVLRQRVDYYAEKMNVSYGRIAVREQKTRWGSCSSLGNLNFNWRLILAPPGVLDYVVVHELAHRKEMNHSKAFWDIVEETVPEYKKYQNWLKNNGMILHRR